VSITPDGRFLLFSSAEPLVPEDEDGAGDTYVLDRLTGTYEMASIGVDGGPDGISANGRFVVLGGENDPGGFQISAVGSRHR
jgi:hypothetical protein